MAAALTLSSAPDGPRFAPGEAPPSLRRAVARAERAIRAAACDVEERFGEGEPDASAVGCAEVAAAPDIPGVTVGRTSARLRNPANAPPAWARGYVAETDGRQAAAVPPLAFDLGDRVGLLRPIAIRARCLRCHAPAEKLSEATRAWLSRAYPQDRALGYALGDLRGFWWAEAPKR
ncbi:MAG TPA: DUF3365 domain-containing protein [Anaeromyxobacteraceae bacterium]|nr:DUF3365 domain-containing protein [Anaeromyxobacteraceae bacterium]